MTTLRLILGDSFEVIATLDGVSAVVTDPPYLIDFMGKNWDAGGGGTENEEWHRQWLQECFDILPSGGIIKVFSATRTFHRLAAAIEQAGFLLDPEHSLEGWGYGCLSEDTEILTKEGWGPYHKAKVGTEVCGFDPTTERFTWQPVEDTFEYPYDRNAFRIHGDGTDQIVSEQHRCVVEREGKWEFVRSGDLADAEVVPCLSVGVCAQASQAGVVWPLLCESSQGLQEEALVGEEGSDGGLHGLRHPKMVSRCVAAEDQATDVLQEMQRGASGAGLGEARAQGDCCGDTRGTCVCDPQDDRPEQPRVERGGDIPISQGQLQADQMRSVPSRIQGDVSVQWVCGGASLAGGTDLGPGSDPERNGPPRQPRFPRQPDREPDAVRLESGPQAVRVARSTSPDLVRVSARVERIHYKGIVWCVKVATGAFVARRNGMVFITGNSGFPKYKNTSKAIDEHFGKTAEREVIEENNPDSIYKPGSFQKIELGGTRSITAAATTEAARFDGWATALKPGWEPFVVGIKP